MKKYLLLLFLGISALAASGQNRKYVGNFSQVRQYYNPATTGQDGSQLKALYRNQWTGYEDAPKTILASAELHLTDLKKSKGYQLNTTDNTANSGPQHGIGLLLLRESFGPYSETQLNLSYSSGVSLSESLRLQWGTAATYTSLALDGNRLTVDQENDPKYIKLLGQNSRSGKVDLNLGITLSSDKFYVGYAMQDVTEGKIMTSGDAFIDDLYARKHVGMAGFRTSLSDNLGIILNTLYQYDEITEGTAEAQLKAVYQNTFWAGGGYRNNQAYSATAGLRLSNLNISYLYESPTGDGISINRSTNEVTLSYLLKSRTHKQAHRRITIW